MDVVVNCMCQFDFLACLMVVGATDNLSDCYPNFGGYYSYRTVPIVHDLIQGGPSRTAVSAMTDQELAELLNELDTLAGNVFSTISGWGHGYGGDEKVSTFLGARGRVK
jgi:hypothetical protein